MHPSNQHPPASTSTSTHGAAPQPYYGPAHLVPTQPGKLLRLGAVEVQTGLKRSSIYAAMRAGTFPLSVRLSVRAVAWRENEVLAWCAERVKTGAPA